MKVFFVWGAGGHAKVVIDAMRVGKDGDCRIVLIDDDPTLRGKRILGAIVEGGNDWLDRQDRTDCVIVPAIGDNRHRENAMEWGRTHGFALASVRHPSAIVGLEAQIADGCFLAPGSIVISAAHLSAGAIVNTGASVDHDCLIGSTVHIGPGARLCGNVSLGTRVLVGVGASIAPGCRIGDDAIVGAGAAVIWDVPPGSVVGGTPARELGKKQ